MPLERHLATSGHTSGCHSPQAEVLPEPSRPRSGLLPPTSKPGAAPDWGPSCARRQRCQSQDGPSKPGAAPDRARSPASPGQPLTGGHPAPGISAARARTAPASPGQPPTGDRPQQAQGSPRLGTVLRPASALPGPGQPSAGRTASTRLSSLA